MQMNYKKRTQFIIGVTIFFAIATLFLFLFKTTKLDTKVPIDTHVFADYGVLVGGIATAILTILNIFLLIQTLNDQRDNFNTQQSNFQKEQKQQRIHFDKGQIESRFFELLKIHRKNSNYIMINDRMGKKIFLSLQREFYQTIIILRTEKLKESGIINIAYLCFFFGAVGINSERTIKEVLARYADAANPNFVNELITMFTQAQIRIQNEEKFDYKPFEGHQSRLGHYFRQLFQLVKYIDDQPEGLLSYSEKYQYIKTLRAQLSTQEQVLLFFNSLSDLGKPWEKEIGLEENKRLITKYNLIKNIPRGYTAGINIKTYYDKLHFEGDGKKPLRRQQLEMHYS
jgi:hypothetical protein